MLAVGQRRLLACGTCALLGAAAVAVAGCSGAGSTGGGSSSRAPSNVSVVAPLRLPSVREQVKSLVGGGFAGYALLSDGHVWAWGDDMEGQIGAAGRWQPYNPTPAMVPGVANVATLVGGENDVYALQHDGTVLAWGDDGLAELGDNSLQARERPVRIHLPSGIVALAAGIFTAYALRQDGTVWSWGGDGWGQLGRTGPQDTGPIPHRVQGLSGVVAIAAGAGDGYALTRAGTVWAWGEGDGGELGRGCDGSQREEGAGSKCLPAATPVRVRGLSDVRSIAAGAFTVYALRRDGTVWGWGDNSFGELGSGARGSTAGSPVRVRGLAHVVAIAAGGYAGYALLPNGYVLAWGRGVDGELGDGRYTNSTAPIAVIGLTDVVTVNAGGDAAYAIDARGRLWAWGSDNYGQLGDGQMDTVDAPTALAGVLTAARLPGPSVRPGPPPRLRAALEGRPPALRQLAQRA